MTQSLGEFAENMKEQGDLESQNLARRRVYMGEGPRISVRSGEFSFTGWMLDICPQGLGLALAGEVETPFPRVGDLVEVNYGQRNGSQTPTKGKVVSSVWTRLRGYNIQRVGIIFEDESVDASEPGDRRTFERIACPRYVSPAAFCEHPFFFQERLHFHVTDFSSKGMGLLTSVKNRHVVQGMTLHLNLFLPMLGTVECSVVVRRVHEKMGRDFNRVSVVFLKVTEDALTAISEYLILSNAVSSLEFLTQRGFPVSKMARAMSFDYAATEVDMKSIQTLRMHSNLLPLWSSTHAQDEKDGMDQYDRFARQMICKIGSDVVGAARLIFIDGRRERSEIAQLTPNFPADFLKEKVVEAGRFAIGRDYRLSEIFWSFIQHIARITMESGNRHLLMATNEVTWPIFEKLGFHKMGLGFDSTAEESSWYEVVSLDVRKAVMERVSVDPGVWERVFAPLSRHLRALGSNRALDIVPSKTDKK